MSNYTQTQKGHAFEFALARALTEVIPTECVENNPAYGTAQNSFQMMSASIQEEMKKAAREAATFLCAFDLNLASPPAKGLLFIQSAQDARKRADVRDIVVRYPNYEFGISAKNKSLEQRAPRLSDKIDFGKEWLCKPVSSHYWNKVKPLFQDLRLKKREGLYWNQLSEKEEIYRRVILAFRDELMRIQNRTSESNIPEKLVRFILGQFDFYQITKENGAVSIASFNLGKNLGWGNRVPLPNRILFCDLEPESNNRLLLVCDRGWQIHFRIHNASSKVEPSLKFSVTIVGWPKVIARHVIPLYKSSSPQVM